MMKKSKLVKLQKNILYTYGLNVDIKQIKGKKYELNFHNGYVNRFNDDIIKSLNHFEIYIINLNCGSYISNAEYFVILHNCNIERLYPSSQDLSIWYLYSNCVIGRILCNYLSSNIHVNFDEFRDCNIKDIRYMYRNIQSAYLVYNAYTYSFSGKKSHAYTDMIII